MKDESSTRARSFRCRLEYPAAAALILACGSDVTTSVPPPIEERQFRVVGGGGTDTIESRLLQALIVEIRDSTLQLARGKTIRFEGLPPDDPNRQYESTIMVASLGATEYAPFGIGV